MLTREVFTALKGDAEDVGERCSSIFFDSGLMLSCLAELSESQARFPVPAFLSRSTHKSKQSKDETGN